jgi:glycosyltransferase involved in cell wall biosynthesis
VLVVDNAPENPAASVCAKWAVAYHVEPVPGLSSARNRGARLSRSDVVAYTDDDAVPEPGWVAALMREFSDPGIVATAGRVRYLKSDAAGLRLRGEEVEDDRALSPPRVFDRDTENWLATACFGGIGDGGSMALRRSLFDLRKGFDERLGRGCLIAGGEEHFAWVKLIDRGFRISYTPAAVVRHPYPSTEAEELARRVTEMRTLAAYILFLWAELPGHRLELAHYVIGSALGVKSVRWRPKGKASRLLHASKRCGHWWRGWVFTSR